MENLRSLIKMKRIPMWKIAEAVGIHPSTLCVWFRSYNEDHYKRIMKAIEVIEGEERHDEKH